MTLGLFFIGELALRTVQWLKFGQQKSVEASSAYFIDDRTGLRLNVPNRQLGRIRINNLGFRGPDIEMPKPTDTVRLAFLGSSTTYEPYSPEGQNWPHLVADKLAERLIDCRVDFVNGGKPGYDSTAMTTLFEQYMSVTEPDIVLILPSDTNSDLDWLAKQQDLDTDHTSYRSPLYGYSLLLQRLEKNFRILSLQRAADSRAGKLELEMDKLVGRFQDNLTGLVNSVTAEQRLLVLITITSQLRHEMDMKALTKAGNTRIYYMPYIYLPDLVTLRDAYNDAVHKVAEANNLVLVTGENDIPGDRQYFQDSVHFTPAGSEAMANRVIRMLLENPSVYEMLQDRGCGIE